MKRFFFISIWVSCTVFLYGQINLGPAVVVIDGNAILPVNDFKKITPSNDSVEFHITEGVLNISVSGILDRSSAPQVMVSLFAEETVYNDLRVVARHGNNNIELKMSGVGVGNYGGLYNNGYFLIKTRFKLISPEKQIYFLDLPVAIHLSPYGQVSFNSAKIDGTGSVINGKKN